LYTIDNQLNVGLTVRNRWERFRTNIILGFINPQECVIQMFLSKSLSENIKKCRRNNL